VSAHFEPDELRELEQRLTERLESIAPRPRPAAEARVRAEIVSTSQRHGLLPWLRIRARRFGWARIASVATVAVAAVAVGLGLASTGFFAVGKSPAPSPSGIASKSFGRSWQQVPVDPSKGRLVIGGFVGSDRSVLTGQMPATGLSVLGFGPAAWYSDDLTTWHRSSVIAAGTAAISVQDLGPIVQVGDRLVAMGRAYAVGESSGPASPPRLSVPFISTDGGATWIQATEGTPATGGWVLDVVAGGPGYVAVGGGPEDGLRIWIPSTGWPGSRWMRPRSHSRESARSPGSLSTTGP
jgi:hypothetical protein